MTEPLVWAVEQLHANAQRSRIVWGTVVDYVTGPDTAVPIARVLMDGDPPGSPPASVVVATGGVIPGDRVPVTYDPPHGAVVYGSLNSARNSGSRPYATFIVAADSSVAPGHENADFVCDGTNDTTQITTAIGLCADAGFGRVELLEGVFFVDYNELALPTRVVLAGQGRDSTRLSFQNGPGLAVTLTGGTLERLTVDLGSVDDDHIAVGGANASGRVVDVHLLGTGPL